MTTNHTPGPYRVSYDPLPDNPPLVFIEARRAIAGTWVRLAELLYYGAETDATANLLAAAPALLAALEACRMLLTSERRRYRPESQSAVLTLIDDAVAQARDPA